MAAIVEPAVNAAIVAAILLAPCCALECVVIRKLCLDNPKSVVTEGAFSRQGGRSLAEELGKNRAFLTLQTWTLGIFPLAPASLTSLIKVRLSREPDSPHPSLLSSGDPSVRSGTQPSQLARKVGAFCIACKAKLQHAAGVAITGLALAPLAHLGSPINLQLCGLDQLRPYCPQGGNRFHDKDSRTLSSSRRSRKSACIQ